MSYMTTNIVNYNISVYGRNLDIYCGRGIDE